MKTRTIKIPMKKVLAVLICAIPFIALMFFEFGRALLIIGSLMVGGMATMVLFPMLIEKLWKDEE